MRTILLAVALLPTAGASKCNAADYHLGAHSFFSSDPDDEWYLRVYIQAEGGSPKFLEVYEYSGPTQVSGSLWRWDRNYHTLSGLPADLTVIGQVWKIENGLPYYHDTFFYDP